MAKSKALKAKPKASQRHPHVADAPNTMLVPTVDDGPVAQTWDDSLFKRLVEVGKKYGVDEYDPVIAMAEMALDPLTDEAIKFRAHAEVAKYVRLKRQLEPIVQQTNITINNMPPEKRDRRIEELTALLNDDGVHEVQ